MAKTDAAWLAPALDYVQQWLSFQMRLSGQPGCALAISHRGKIVLDTAFGHANALKNEKLTPRHRFRVVGVVEVRRIDRDQPRRESPVAAAQAMQMDLRCGDADGAALPRRHRDQIARAIVVDDDEQRVGARYADRKAVAQR